MKTDKARANETGYRDSNGATPWKPLMFVGLPTVIAPGILAWGRVGAGAVKEAEQIGIIGLAFAAILTIVAIKSGAK